jgi:8-oxo-dGTP pyrophosphatase MutT (NUDIX family)
VTPPVSRRPAEEADREFLFRLLEQSLRKYVEQAFGGWDEAAQREMFAARLLLPTHEILERDGRAIGCLSTAQLPDAIALYRVFLLPEAQGQGLGSALVRELIARGAALGLPVRLRVFKANPAHELYRRLGFAVVGETATHFQMERAARMAAGGVLVRDGRVLLGLRRADRASYPGVWDVFGGHCEGSESPREALARELVEELGIELRACAPLASFPGYFVFHVGEWLGEPANLGDEHDEIAWVTAAELAELPLASPRYPALLAPLLA